MVNEFGYKQVLDSLNTAVIVVDTALTVQHLNPSAEMLLAVSAASVNGEALTAHFHESDAAVQALYEAVEQGLNYTKRRAEWRLANGEKLTVDYTVTPQPDGQGLLIEVVPLDRLLRINRDEALIAAQETTRNLVRGMAHEIKNPLGGIRGAAQLLERELDSEDQKEYTRIVIEEADRLRNLVDRMLGPNQPLKRSAHNIHEVLERVTSLINAEDNSIKLIRDYDPSIPDIEGDKELLIQAVLNIVRNAMQALQENTDANYAAPSITLKTRIQRHFTAGKNFHPMVCKLIIEDNGPGIPAKLIEDVFYPMISGRAEGTGLGLAISQQLINLHQGLIECESKPGLTQFTLYIPMTPRAMEQQDEHLTAT